MRKIYIFLLCVFWGAFNISHADTFVSKKGVFGGITSELYGHVTVGAYKELDYYKVTPVSEILNNNDSAIITSGKFVYSSINSVGDLTVKSSNFNHGSSASSGGAISINSVLEDNLTTLTSNTFNNNSATNGGAIYVKEGNVVINKNTFGSYANNGNHATENGGAIYNEGSNTSITSSKFSNNSAKNGGDIYNSGTLTIKKSTFGSNPKKITISKKTKVVYGESNGDTDIVIPDLMDKNLIHYTDKGVPFYAGSYAEVGGSIFNSESGVLNVSSSTFNQNRAEKGGALYNAGTLISNKNTFKNNSATNGGAIYNDGYAEITKNTFKTNSAVSGGAIYNAGEASITSSSFSSNKAESGAAIFNEGNANITSSSFSKNNATLGGAVYNTGKTEVFAGKFTSNKATSGGATYNTGTYTSDYKTSYSSNSAKNGGAIFNNGTMTLNSGSFSKNSAIGIATERDVTFEKKDYKLADMDGGMGGAIYNAQDGVLDINRYEYLSGKKTKYSNPVFSSNKGLKGGAIFNEGTLDIDYANFKSNKVTAPNQNSIVEKCKEPDQLYYSPVGGAICNSGTILSDTQFLNEKNNYVYNIVKDGYIGTDTIGEHQVLYKNTEAKDGVVFTYSTDEKDVTKYNIIKEEEQYIVFNGKYYDTSLVDKSVDYDKSMQLTDTQVVVNGKLLDFAGLTAVEGKDYVADTNLNQYSIVVNGLVYSTESADSQKFVNGLTNINEDQFVYNGKVYDTSKIESNGYNSGVYINSDQLLYNGKVYNISDLKPKDYEQGTQLESDELAYNGIVYKYVEKWVSGSHATPMGDGKVYYRTSAVLVDKIYSGETPSYDKDTRTVGYNGLYYNVIRTGDSKFEDSSYVQVEIDGKWYELAPDNVQVEKVYVAPSNLKNGQIVVDGKIYDFSNKDLKPVDYLPTTNLQTGQIVVDGKVYTCFTDENKDKGVVYIPNPDKDKGQIVHDGLIYDINDEKSATKGEYYIKSDMTITNASFSSNTASSKVHYEITDDKKVVNLSTGMGGAIYNSSEGLVKITDTKFSKNSAAQAGGAIYSAAPNGTLEIDGSTFTSNSAKSIATTVTTVTDPKTKKESKVTKKENAGDGGAIYTLSKTSIKNSTFKSNVSYRTGGAIFSGGDLTIDNCTFQSNKSMIEAGAIYAAGKTNITNTTFTSNTANIYGGAVYAAGDVTISDSIFKSNTSKYQGGALFVLGEVAQKNNTFTGNTAEEGGAVCVYFSGNAWFRIPGIFTDGVAKVVVDNKAYEYTDVSVEEKEGYTKVGHVYYKLDEKSVETLEEPVENGVQVSDGSEFINNTAKTMGGAIVNYGNLYLNGTHFDNNKAQQGGTLFNRGTAIIQQVVFENTKKKIAAIGGYIVNVGEIIAIGSSFDKGLALGDGGAIYNQAVSLNLYNNTFENNQAGYRGGAIYHSAGTLTSAENTYKKNVASIGGAIFAQKDVNLSKDNFEENTAYYGGAIYSVVNQELDSNGRPVVDKDGKPKPIVNAELTINDTTFTKNKAQLYAGAIYTLNTNITGHNVTFESNSAGLYGGAILIAGEKDIAYIDSSNFKENKANMYGGAIYNAGTLNINVPKPPKEDSDDKDKDEDKDKKEAVQEPEVTFTTTYFTKNFSDNGGAIYNDPKGKIDLRDVVFEGNYVTCNGGAIHNAGYIDITDSKFIGNYAYIKSKENKGGAIYNNLNEKGDAYLKAVNTIFTGNYADWGGAIYNVATLTLKDCIVGVCEGYEEGNHAKTGGAIWNSGIVNLDNTVLNGNYATNNGGAIYNSGTVNSIGAEYGKNNANNGGAIYNSATLFINTIADETDSSGIFDLKKTVFENNTATTNGGAIFNSYVLEIGINNKSNETLVNLYDYNEENQIALFSSNTAKNGGAIYSSNTIYMGNAAFVGNKAEGGSGGAIYNTSYILASNTLFDGNSATNNGGAIYSNSTNNVYIRNSRFTNNQANNGGAIYSKTLKFYDDDNKNKPLSIGNTNFGMYDSTTGTVSGGNHAVNAGGAIYLDSNSYAEIFDCNFYGNSAGNNGGAIYVGEKSVLTLIDSSFINNTAGNLGGAIYADKNSEVWIYAEGKNVLFEGNKAGGQSSAIHLNNAKLYLTATHDYSITINDYVTGTGTIYAEGKINLVNEDFVSGKTTTLVLKDAYLNLANNRINTLSLASFSADKTSRLGIDISLKDRTSDKVQATNVESVTPVNVSSVNIVTNSKTPVTINIGKDSIVSSISAKTAESAEATYKLKSYYDENGLLRVVAYGQRAKPSAVAAPVAAQIGGYLTQINSYDQAFMNMDMNMLVPRSEREAMQQTYSCENKDNIEYNGKGLWNRPYATFERVNLNNGPKVNNIGYGNYFGGDADMKQLNNGWRRQFSAYVGYNGSVQDYDRQSIDQNGGTVGVTEVWYKNNFFTGLTLNAGANVAQASTDLGRENMPMFMTGIASKTGYNFEFKECKFIVQPSLLLSYSFIHTFAHDNGLGHRVSSSPLNAIQVAPGIKFIANLKNGWQPYFNVNMRWNIIDKTHFALQDVTIPDMSIDPYVEYGLGLQRRWGERFTGFGQAMIRNGGRNGVMLSFGFKWLIGR